MDLPLGDWVAPTAPTTFDFYIDASHGNDANDGHSPNTAWATFAHLAKDSFAPGTTIGLKRGEVWREDLQLNSSGTSAAPIVVGAYGVGDAPRVTGGSVLTGWTAAGTDAAGNQIQTASLSADPKILVMNGSPLVRESTTDLARLDVGEWLYKDQHVYVKPGAATQAVTTPTTPTAPGVETQIVISASGTSAGGVFPHFKVLVDGTVIGDATAASTTVKDYVFKTSAATGVGHKVQVQFDNDAYINGQDRNLTVSKMSINGSTVLPTSSSVVYDRGALDGQDVLPGQSLMNWNGTLVANAPAGYFPAPVTTGASTIVVNASGSTAGGAYAHFNVLVDGVKVGEGTTAGTAKDFVFTPTLTKDAAHKVQVQFDNDAYINGQDRNLFVNKVTINGKAVLPTAPIVTYDKGALDGRDVIAGQSGMWWSGTLVVNADKTYFPTATSTTVPTTTAPKANVFEIPTRAGVLDLDGQHDVTVRDLRIDLGADRTVTASDSTRVTLMDLVVRDSTKIDRNGAISFVHGSDGKVLGLEMYGIVGTLPIYSWQHDRMEIAHTYVRSINVGAENIVHLDGGTDPSEGYRLYNNVFDLTGSNTPKHVVNVGQSTVMGSRGGGYIGYNHVLGGNGGLSVNNSGTASNPVVVEHNIVEGYGKVTGDTWPGGFYSPNTVNQDYVYVHDNTFRNGTNGIAMYGAPKSNMRFENNVISGMTGYGLYAETQVSGQFTGNTVQNVARQPVYVQGVIPGQSWVVR